MQMTGAITPLWQQDLEPGEHTSLVLRRGLALRLTDLEGGANVSALLFSHEDRLERYNMPDTLKAQHTAYLTAGHVCYSDMGRILASIVADDCGWHDTICGVSHAADLQARFGAHRFQEHRNAMHRNGHDSLLVELGKHGLGRRDLHAPVNFFSKVSVGEDGELQFAAGHSRAGQSVDLRAEMDLLLALSGAPHPLDPADAYRPGRVRLAVHRVEPVAADDLCRTSCEQNRRGFINTERHALR
jgi:uncharacterized protein